MGTIYSFQLGAVASAEFGTSEPTDFFVAEPPNVWVVRDISGYMIFGSSGDSFEVGILLGGSGQRIPLLVWDESRPNPQTLQLRLVMDPIDTLYWLATASGPGPFGGFVVSGYRLTPP